MNKVFSNFYEAWWWLQEHPAFYNPRLVKEGHPNYVCQNFQNALDIDFQKVNPLTGKIDDDNSLNIEVECWLECGGFYLDDGFVGHYHDPDLDCGGKTFEEAILELANKVSYHYSNTGEKIEERAWYHEAGDKVNG